MHIHGTWNCLWWLGLQQQNESVIFTRKWKWLRTCSSFENALRVFSSPFPSSKRYLDVIIIGFMMDYIVFAGWLFASRTARNIMPSGTLCRINRNYISNFWWLCFITVQLYTHTHKQLDPRETGTIPGCVELTVWSRQTLTIFKINVHIWFSDVETLIYLLVIVYVSTLCIIIGD